LTSEIIQTDALTEAEKEKLFGWGDDIFGANDLNLHWRPKDLHFLLHVLGETVSHVGVLQHEISVDGKPVLVGGVGGVVTPPAWQKRGHARKLMQHTARFFETAQVDAGLLFCLRRRVPFYESQGWQLLQRPVWIQQPAGEIVAPLEVMVLPIGKSKWPDGEVRLNSFPW
jgi:GNAT superfamily N-acetyltransferase